jgi:hypothetical protein
VLHHRRGFPLVGRNRISRPLVFRRLGLEAWVQDSNIVRLMTEAVAGAIKRGMIQEILQKDISVSDA